jgi:hypothetical protein
MSSGPEQQWYNEALEQDRIYEGLEAPKSNSRTQMAQQLNSLWAQIVREDREQQEALALKRLPTDQIPIVPKGDS